MDNLGEKRKNHLDFLLLLSIFKRTHIFLEDHVFLYNIIHPNDIGPFHCVMFGIRASNSTKYKLLRWNEPLRTQSIFSGVYPLCKCMAPTFIIMAKNWMKIQCSVSPFPTQYLIVCNVNKSIFRLTGEK